MENPDYDLKFFVSVLAMIISVISLYFTWWNWRRSNRPIVVAYIDEENPGESTATFNLHLANAGTRPATCIRLHLPQEGLDELIEDGASDVEKEIVGTIFLAESEVPLLRQSEELTTSFGAYLSEAEKGKRWLNYGAEVKIRITYEDLDGRKYTSNLPLKIYARNGFGGGVWQRSTKNA